MKTKKKEQNVLKFFIEYYKRFSIPWWLYFLSMGCGILYAEITLKVSEYLIQVNKGELYNSVIIGYVLLSLFNAFISFAENLLQAYGNQKIIFRARKMVWNKILHLPAKNVEEESPSSLISAVTTESEEASSVISMLFLFVASIYGFGRACVTLYQYQASLTLYMLCAIPVAVFVFYIVGKTQYFSMKKRYASIQEMTTFFSEHLSAGKYVKAHSMEDKELENGYQAINARYRADIFYAFMSALQTFLNSIYTALTTVILSVGGANLIQTGRMESSGINTFSTYMSRINQYLAEILTDYQTLMGTKGSLSHVNHVLNLESENPDEGEAWRELKDKDIYFEHVNFGYVEGTPIVKDLSLHIPAGKTTAIIGDNGCGKSTVLKLMQGFYRPQGGVITVAGNQLGSAKLEDLRSQFGSVRMMDLREHFGYVLQTNPLFAGTIRENIAYGLQREVTQEEIEEAAKAACAHEFIMQFPDGYDTMIGESGSQLSGGQRQRIAIARTLILHPQYLILDEAGASIDYETYQKIYQNIKKMYDTIIFIAHDMREVVKADYIIVLNHGRFEAAGTHEELLQSSQTYKDYMQAQAE